jgi:hypothetical protein
VFLLQLVTVSSVCQTHLPSRLSDLATQMIASPANPDHARLPTLSKLDVQQVDVYRVVSREPAPMGITDYGVGPSGPYKYATNSSVGIVTINSFSTRDSRGSRSVSIQLNVNLLFTSNDGQYVYWIQSVAYIDTFSRVITFIDNVWNSSAPSASMHATGISGNGTLALSKNTYFYYCFAEKALLGNNIHLTYPATITLNVTSELSSSSQPAVSFAYNDGHGLITYDKVTLTAPHGLKSLSGFEVNGFEYNPLGLFYDSELILGGPGGGSQTTDLQSDAQLQLEYWNGHNYETVANAYNFGSNTAERIGNVLSQFSHFSDSGTMAAEIRAGAGQPSQLYDESQIGTIDISSPLTSGILYVANASDPAATARQYEFVNLQVAVTLYPGYYNLQLRLPSGEVYDQGNFDVNAGQKLTLQTPFNQSAHSISITSVVTTKTVIGEGFSANITVHAVNNGQHSETFNVTTYANTTVIGTQQVIDLNATDEKVLTFIWNTTGFAKGNYTISAYAELVPDETNTGDSNVTSNKIIVLSIPGDINGDGKVDILDVATAAKAYGSSTGEQNFEPNPDVNNDGIVNILDMSIIAREYEKTA